MEPHKPSSKAQTLKFNSTLLRELPRKLGEVMGSMQLVFLFSRLTRCTSGKGTQRTAHRATRVKTKAPYTCTRHADNWGRATKKACQDAPIASSVGQHIAMDARRSGLDSHRVRENLYATAILQKMNTTDASSSSGLHFDSGRSGCRDRVHPPTTCSQRPNSVGSRPLHDDCLPNHAKQ